MKPWLDFSLIFSGVAAHFLNGLFRKFMSDRGHRRLFVEVTVLCFQIGSSAVRSTFDCCQRIFGEFSFISVRKF